MISCVLEAGDGIRRKKKRAKSKGQGPGLQVTNPPNYEGGQVLHTTKADKS